MGIFPRYIKEYKLKIDNIYLVCDGSRIKKAKLVRTTERGFNLKNVKTGKMMFKKQLYPIETIRENVPELTFRFIANITIDEE
jgi:hypothetical protein